jgi:NADH dehydrogenase (ubiquinone) 1 alpha subcomplex subunit 9
MYGHEDKFLHNMAGQLTFFFFFVRPSRISQSLPGWPIWWKLNDGRTRVRPVQVGLLYTRKKFFIFFGADLEPQVLDVAQALVNLLQAPPLAHTLNLPGPSTLTYEWLLQMVSSLTYLPPSRAPVVPKRMAKAITQLGRFVWWPTLTADQVERRFIDDVDVPGDWDVFGITPEEIEDSAIIYLRRYRTACVSLNGSGSAAPC